MGDAQQDDVADERLIVEPGDVLPRVAAGCVEVAQGPRGRRSPPCFRRRTLDEDAGHDADGDDGRDCPERQQPSTWPRRGHPVRARRSGQRLPAGVGDTVQCQERCLSSGHVRSCVRHLGSAAHGTAPGLPDGEGVRMAVPGSVRYALPATPGSTGRSSPATPGSSGAQFSGDARFDESWFATSSGLGRLACARVVNLSGVVLEVPVPLEIAALEVRCEQTHAGTARR